AGKTVTRIIPPGPAMDQTRRQLEEYHRYRQLVQQLLTVSEQICDCQLRHPEPESEGLKKNFTRRPPRRSDSVGYRSAAGSPEPGGSGSRSAGVSGPATGVAVGGASDRTTSQWQPGRWGAVPSDLPLRPVGPLCWTNREDLYQCGGTAEVGARILSQLHL